jgi:hypothetical protein
MAGKQLEEDWEIMPRGARFSLGDKMCELDLSSSGHQEESILIRIKAYFGLAAGDCILYKDDEGDMVTIGTDTDVIEALQVADGCGWGVIELTLKNSEKSECEWDASPPASECGSEYGDDEDYTLLPWHTQIKFETESTEIKSKESNEMPAETHPRSTPPSRSSETGEKSEGKKVSPIKAHLMRAYARRLESKSTKSEAWIPDEEDEEDEHKDIDEKIGSAASFFWENSAEWKAEYSFVLCLLALAVFIAMIPPHHRHHHRHHQHPPHHRRHHDHRHHDHHQPPHHNTDQIINSIQTTVNEQTVAISGLLKTIDSLQAQVKSLTHNRERHDACSRPDTVSKKTKSKKPNDSTYFVVSPVHVHWAWYGDPKARNNSDVTAASSAAVRGTEVTRKLRQLLTACVEGVPRVQATNANFGDAAHGVRKSLYVSYSTISAANGSLRFDTAVEEGQWLFFSEGGVAKTAREEPTTSAKTGTKSDDETEGMTEEEVEAENGLYFADLAYQIRGNDSDYERVKSKTVDRREVEFQELLLLDRGIEVRRLKAQQKQQEQLEMAQATADSLAVAAKVNLALAAQAKAAKNAAYELVPKQIRLADAAYQLPIKPNMTLERAKKLRQTRYEEVRQAVNLANATNAYARLKREASAPRLTFVGFARSGYLSGGGRKILNKKNPNAFLDRRCATEYPPHLTGVQGIVRTLMDTELLGGTVEGLPADPRTAPSFVLEGAMLGCTEAGQSCAERGSWTRSLNHRDNTRWPSTEKEFWPCQHWCKLVACVREERS